MYNAEIGRFLQRDPIEYEGGINLYRYVGGAPVIHGDPTGKDQPGHPGAGVPSPPPPFPGPGSAISLPNVKGEHVLCCLFAEGKRERLRPIAGVETLKLGQVFPQGPAGGNHTFYTPPFGNAMVGGGGSTPCIIVVIKCPNGISVFHFSPGAPGDYPGQTLRRYTWPTGCHAIVCGGDDSRQSNCLADDAINSLSSSGIALDGVSAKDACGWSTKDNRWYESNREEWGRGK